MFDPLVGEIGDCIEKACRGDALRLGGEDKPLGLRLLLLLLFDGR